MRGAQHSAPGPDALPFAAWQAHPFGEVVLWDALEWVADGQFLFASASDTIQICLPKNVTDTELQSGGCERAPDK
eukprot:3926904-Pyramimonas_sp.AAC.1